MKCEIKCYKCHSKITYSKKEVKKLRISKKGEIVKYEEWIHINKIGSQTIVAHKWGDELRHTSDNVDNKIATHKMTRITIFKKDQHNYYLTCQICNSEVHLYSDTSYDDDSSTVFEFLERLEDLDG